MQIQRSRRSPHSYLGYAQDDMGVGYGLLAALCWGVGDYAITTLARQVGTAKSLLVIQAFSLLIWICLLALFPRGAGGSTSIWAIALIAGAFHVLGLVCT